MRIFRRLNSLKIELLSLALSGVLTALTMAASVQARASAPETKASLFGLPVVERKLMPPQLLQKNRHSKFVISAPEDRYLLSVKLGRLSAGQFDHLKADLGQVSDVTYNPNRSYDLVDFLPRYFQAVMNSTFKFRRENLKLKSSGGDYSEVNHDLGDGLLIATNCFGFAREAISLLGRERQQDREAMFFFEGRVSAEILRDDTYSRDVSNEPVKPYDVFLAVADDPQNRDGSALLHAAIYIDENILAEKIDSASVYPYRLSKLDDVKAKYLAAPGLKVHFLRRRFNESSHPSLPKKETGIWGESGLEKPLDKDIVSYVEHLFPVNSVGMSDDLGIERPVDRFLVSIKKTPLIDDPQSLRAEIDPQSTVARSLMPLAGVAAK